MKLAGNALSSTADLRRRPITPGSFTQHRPCNRAAGLGNAARPYRAAAALLAGSEAEVGNELSRMSEAGEVSDLSEHSGGDDWTDTLQCLESLHLLGPRRARDHFSDLLLDSCLAGLIMLERVEVGLERNLLRWMGERSVAEPHPVSATPGLTFEAQVATEHERLDPDAVPADILTGCVPRSYQVAQCFMKRVRYPDIGELTGPVQTSQSDGVAPVILDPLAGLSWRQRGCRSFPLPRVDAERCSRMTRPRRRPR